MAPRRKSYTSVVYDSRLEHSYPEDSLIFSLRIDSPPANIVHPPVWQRQSPIDIITSDVEFNPDICDSPLAITYPRHLQHYSTLQNTGHTWKVNVVADNYSIHGGPLTSRYQLDQIHAHWGERDTDGSEHRLDGHQFAGEMHFVHWNQGMYKDISEAMKHQDGLAVIGVFYKIGKPNLELSKLTDLMEEVKYSSCKAEIDHLELDILRLLPQDYSKYWTYSGSLTTQPYTECVTWIVLEHPIEISSRQIQAMRRLLALQKSEIHHKDCSHGMGSCREIQTWQTKPVVYSSFRHEVAGHQQSPVDICTKMSIFNWNLTQWPLVIHYPNNVKDACKLTNTGHTWKIVVDNEHFWINGGPLKNAYTLDQVHGHWGSTDDCGSEHTVDGLPYSGEIHFVHWNRKYGTIEQAMCHRDGLAVVGVFLEIGNFHPELTKLTDAVDAIRYAGNITEVININFQKFLPSESLDYWTYPGSLTTPPYTECVVWIVLKNPIKVSSDQLTSMRSLCGYKQCDATADVDMIGHGRLLQNYRPVQKLRTNLQGPSYSVMG